MRAAFYTRQGTARAVLATGDQPVSEPGPGEVRVRLRYSGVNPSDCKTRQGGGGRGMVAPLIIPHSDGAGVIDAVGTGVNPARIAQRVWIWNGQWQRACGTAAEWVTVPTAQAVPSPSTLGDAEGACLGIPAFTAMHAIRVADPHPGHTVLVAGGAGSVGHYAIQMAKARGARVIATASTEGKVAHAYAAGADLVLDYRSQSIAPIVHDFTHARGVDAVIEVNLTANAASYPGVVAAHGKVVVYGITGSEALLPALWMMQGNISLDFFRIYDISAPDRAAALNELTQLLEEQRLQHTIALRLPLEKVADAHEAVERGALVGRVLLDLNSSGMQARP